MVRYVFIALLAAGLTVAISLLWPLFTKRTRPLPLQAVHDASVNTVLGEQIAKTLGVDNDTPVEPINVPAAAAKIAGDLVSKVEQNASQAVVTTITNQLVKQIDQLPATQQAQLKEFICKQ